MNKIIMTIILVGLIITSGCRTNENTCTQVNMGANTINNSRVYPSVSVKVYPVDINDTESIIKAVSMCGGYEIHFLRCMGDQVYLIAIKR